MGDSWGHSWGLTPLMMHAVGSVPHSVPCLSNTECALPTVDSSRQGFLFASAVFRVSGSSPRVSSSAGRPAGENRKASRWGRWLPGLRGGACQPVQASGSAGGAGPPAPLPGGSPDRVVRMWQRAGWQSVKLGAPPHSTAGPHSRRILTSVFSIEEGRGQCQGRRAGVLRAKRGFNISPGLARRELPPSAAPEIAATGHTS